MTLRPAIRLLLAALLLTAACSDPIDPVIVDEGMITVQNQTEYEWRDVRLIVNDYFGGGVSSLQPGARMNATLSSLQTGHGQKFDRGRMSVYKVEVTATDAAGRPVKLTWSGNRARP